VQGEERGQELVSIAVSAEKKQRKIKKIKERIKKKSKTSVEEKRDWSASLKNAMTLNPKP